MKATGVVRRIDDLGRIVLPKELRRTMRIKEGESLEIYTDGDNKIVLKNTNKELANELANRLNAKLRITSDGSFATLTLRNNETILDVVSNPDNEDILQYLSIVFLNPIHSILQQHLQLQFLQNS